MNTSETNESSKTSGSKSLKKKSSTKEEISAENSKTFTNAGTQISVKKNTKTTQQNHKSNMCLII